MSATITLYVYKNGQTCQVPQKAFKKLLSEMKAGRGGKEVNDLISSGYSEFLGASGEAYDMSGMTLELLGY